MIKYNKYFFMNIKHINQFNNSVSYCPERGGIITSLKFNGQEVLYFDEETFNDLMKNVRGGIPILFPNAGALREDSEFSALKQHGFARSLIWESENLTDIFTETLLSGEETRKIYPYDFLLSVIGKFKTDGSFDLNCKVKNREASKSLPISMGLHPYFKVPSGEKNNIKFDFEGGEEAENKREVWLNGGTLYLDNPKLKNPEAVLKIKIPGLGKLIIDASVQYQKIWIWSQLGKDFICIEPMLRDLDGLLDNPEIIKPGEEFSANINFKLQK